VSGPNQPQDSPIGVVIPAHNEESVVARCLEALLESARPGEFEVVVAANGCTDNTAEIARRYPVKVIELGIGSKPLALNAADSALPPNAFPRIYLDADLVLDTEAARQIARDVANPGILAAAPRFLFDLSASSWLVRAYYKAWSTLPYMDSGRIAGAYALSETGRKRFLDFPDLISDDGFVRLQFSPSERMTDDGVSVAVVAPGTAMDLIRTKTRSRLGTVQLRQRYPELVQNDNTGDKATTQRMLAMPSKWPLYVVYLAFNLIARWRAAQQLGGDQPLRWERDESSRV